MVNSVNTILEAGSSFDISSLTDMLSNFNPNDIFSNIVNAFQPDQMWESFIVWLKGMIPAPVVELYNTHTVPFTLALICLLVLFAFEGYKLFKMLVYVIGGLGCGIWGYWNLVNILPENIIDKIPENIDAHVLAGIVCALVAVAICKFAYPLAIALIGGVTGFMLGSGPVFDLLNNKFPDLDGLLNNDTFKFIVGAVFAAILSIVFYILFKQFFIILSSIGCMICASLLLQGILVPSADDNLKTTFLIVGVVIGVLAMIHQHKEEEKAMEIVF